ncbi:HNH/ENDO VII family nuclease [Allorhizobium terrae]|uniref:LHH domain-containing protein n=1 Tax=Allorhizobium terrae TaxID=1848972 RepID=A0A4V3W8C9_9HYPH|nr:HNH/ENDO VII family nuclease [Allorhizobium terrae]THF50767.1 hypothetical protein E6C51_07885 [Allorhizobium terrae]
MMRISGFPQIFYEQADKSGGPGSLAQRANALVRGAKNMDIPLEQFLLNVETDLGEHVYQKLMGYAATLHMLGLLAGAIGSAEEQRNAREALTRAINKYLESIKVDDSTNSIYFESAYGADSSGMATAWLLSKWFGLDGARKSIEDAGRANHQANQAVSQMIRDFVSSLWNDLTKAWDDFWKDVDEKGLLYAIRKTQIDAAFLAAEIGITVALSVVTEGAAALALSGLRIVGERVSATVTRVVVKGLARAGERTAERAGVLFTQEIADSQINKRIIKEVFDEEKLGVGTERSDVGRRAELPVKPVEKPKAAEGQSDSPASKRTGDAKRWKPREVNGRRVYQRDDLIDPDFIDPDTGLSNLERMRAGRPPIGPDGEAVELHHMIQEEGLPLNNGMAPLAEVEKTFHSTNYDTIHIYRKGDPDYVSWRKTNPENAKRYDNYRRRYWKTRSNDFVANSSKE